MINKILSARWLVTVFLTWTFCVLTANGRVSAEVFVPVLVITLNYYFKEKERKMPE